MGKSFLASAGSNRPAAQRSSVPISRQDIARAILLGHLRPRRFEILGPSSRAATGRRTHREKGRRRRAGLRRVLARRRTVSTSRLLLIHIPETGWNRVASDRAGPGGLELSARRVCAPVRRHPYQRIAWRSDPPVFREHLRRRRPPWQVGSEPPDRTRALNS